MEFHHSVSTAVDVSVRSFKRIAFVFAVIFMVFYSLDASAATCTFVSQYGGSDVQNMPPPVTFTAMQAVPAPSTTPTWAGCTFDGWFSDPTFTTPFVFNSTNNYYKPLSSFTVYAKWTTPFPAGNYAIVADSEGVNTTSAGFYVNSKLNGALTIGRHNAITVSAPNAMLLHWEDGATFKSLNPTGPIPVESAPLDTAYLGQKTTTFYVSPDGGGYGYSAASPNKLERVQDIIFQYSVTASTDFTINMAAGDYTFSSYVAQPASTYPVPASWYSGSNTAVFDQQNNKGMTVVGAPDFGTVIKGQFLFEVAGTYTSINNKYILRGLNFDWSGMDAPTEISDNDQTGNRMFRSKNSSEPSGFGMVQFLGGTYGSVQTNYFRWAVGYYCYRNPGAAGRYVRNVIVEDCRFANGQGTNKGLLSGRGASTGIGTGYSGPIDPSKPVGIRVQNCEFVNMNEISSQQSTKNIVYDNITAVDRIVNGIASDNNEAPFAILNSRIKTTNYAYRSSTNSGDTFYGGIFRNNILIGGSGSGTGNNVAIYFPSGTYNNTSYNDGLWEMDSNIVMLPNGQGNPMSIALGTSSTRMKVKFTDNYFNGYDPRENGSTWRINIGTSGADVLPYRQMRHRATASDPWAYGMLDTAIPLGGEIELLQNFGTVTNGGTNSNFFGNTINSNLFITGKSTWFADDFGQYLTMMDRPYHFYRGSGVGNANPVLSIPAANSLTLADVSVLGSSSGNGKLVELYGDLNVADNVSIKNDRGANLWIATSRSVTLRGAMANTAKIGFETEDLPRAGHQQVPVAVPTPDYAADFAVQDINGDLAKFVQDPGRPSTAFSKIYATNASGDNTAIVLQIYHVAYESNGGTPVPTEYVNPDQMVLKPTDPTYTDFHFDGWFLDDGTFTNPWNFADSRVNSDVQLYAKWRPIYTVVFEPNGGDPKPADQTHPEGDLVTPVADPAKADYLFGGWYLDNGTFANRWNFADSGIEGDMTLYAMWSNDSVLVTFQPNNTEPTFSTSVIRNRTVTKPADPTYNDGTRDYRFDGWFTDDVTFADAWNFTDSTVPADMTLYAKWTPYWTVSYVSNGGTAVPAEVVIDGGFATEPADPTYNDGTRDYHFDGWFTDDITFLDSWMFVDSAVTADVTLYAKWTPYWTVSYVSNGGTAVPAEVIIDGGFATEPADPTYNDGTRDYHFDGWFTDDVTFLDSWMFVDSAVTADVTLYAKWTPYWTVSYVSNGGSAVNPEVIIDGGFATEPADPTLEYRIFDGWYVDNGTFLNSWNFTDSAVTADVTLYAKWLAGPVVITFDANYDVNEPGVDDPYNDSNPAYTQTTTYGLETILDSSRFYRRDYLFLGWSTVSGVVDTQYTDRDSITCYADTTLYAQWQPVFRIKAVEMVSYMGGSSLSYDPLPRPYFEPSFLGRVLWPDSTVNLQFRIDGKKYDLKTKLDEDGKDFTDTFIYELPYREVYWWKGHPVLEPTIDSFGKYELTLTTYDYVVTVDEPNTGIPRPSYMPDTAILNVREVTPAMTENRAVTVVPDTYVSYSTLVVDTAIRFMNSANVPIYDTAAVALLQDDILPKNLPIMQSVVRKDPISWGKYCTNIYLDTVDSENGNIVVYADRPVDVILPYPYPDKMDSTTKFDIIHLVNADRSKDTFEDSEIIVTHLPAVGVTGGVHFRTPSFSPFALLYPGRFLVDTVPDVMYDGQYQTPKPVVRDYYTEAILTEGIDYEYSYADNLNVGTATITVSGLDSYLTVVEHVNFKILPRPITIVIGPDTVHVGQSFEGPIIDSATGINNEMIRYQVDAPQYNLGTGAGTYPGFLEAFIIWGESSALEQNYIVTIVPGTLYVLRSAVELHLHEFPNYPYNPKTKVTLRTHVEGPDDIVLTYTSSDENVVRVVNNSYLEIVGVGTSVIVVTAGESRHFLSGSDTQQIVIEKGTQYGEIKFDPVSKTAWVEGLADTAGYWSSTNNSIASVYGKDATFAQITDVGVGYCNLIFTTKETRLYLSRTLYSNDAYVAMAPVYTVTAINGSADADTAIAGQLVRLTAESPDTRLIFSHWVSTDVVVINPKGESASFEMPARNVTVMAVYIEPAAWDSLGVFAQGDTIYLTSDSFGLYPDQLPLSKKTKLEAKHRVPYKEIKTKKLLVKMTSDNIMTIKGKLLLLNKKGYNTQRKFGDYTRDILAADSVAHLIQRDSMIVSLQTKLYSDMLHFHMGLPSIIDSAMTPDSLYLIVRTEHGGIKTKAWLEWKPVKDPSKIQRVKRINLKAMKDTKWKAIPAVHAITDTMDGELRVFKLSKKAFKTTGRVDVVIDNRNGYTAEPFPSLAPVGAPVNP